MKAVLTKNKHIFKHKRKAFSFALLLVLFGCAVNVKPITSDQRADRTNSDLQQIFSRQEPIIGKLSIYEAMARAIKYNLDHRIKLIEEVIAQGVVDVSSYDMLPKLAASSGFSLRSNDAGSSSDSLYTGSQTLEPSTSEEKHRKLFDLSMSWNVLDFGVSYVNALQQADRVFIAKELRRKAIQNIVRDVRASFWKAVGAQKLKPELDAIIADIEAALNNTVKDESGDVERLNNQKELLSILKNLLDLRKEAAFAKLELASLMNLDPQQDFVLDETSKPEFDDEDLDINVPIRNMEQQALMNRPELRAKDYEERISAAEVRKELLRYLPGIEVSSSLHHDSNEYLYNKTWAETGIKVTWNLLNFFSGDKRIANAENKLELTKLKRLALNVAILTQVHVAYKRLGQAKEEYQVAKALNNVNEKIYSHSIDDNNSFALSHIDVIKKAADMLISGLKQDFAFAELQDAEGSLHLTLGVDPVPQIMVNSQVASIAETIENQRNDFDENKYSYNRFGDSRYPSRWLAEESRDDDDSEEPDNNYANSYQPPQVPEEIGRWAVGNWLDDVVNELAEKRSREFDSSLNQKKTKPIVPQETLKFFTKQRDAKQQKGFDFKFNEKPKNTGRYQSLNEDDLLIPNSNSNSGSSYDNYLESKISSSERERSISQENPKVIIPQTTKALPIEAKTSSNNSLSIKSNGSKLQLGAYGSLEVAKKEWLNLKSKFSELNKYEPSFENINITGKGILYRMLVSDSPDNIKSLHNNLKNKGQDSIIR
ncbi:MAG: TolC family protein [Alphaproteobacteria bacterium]